MKLLKQEYLFVFGFILVAGYQFYVGDFIEGILYVLAALAFFGNALTREARLIEYKKPLVIITWILTALTLILFVYLLQFKFR